MRAKNVAADELYCLVMECRSSGHADHRRCLEHDNKLPCSKLRGIRLGFA